MSAERGTAQVRSLVIGQPHVAECLEQAPFTEENVLQAKLTCELVHKLQQHAILLNDAKCDATQGQPEQQQAHAEAMDLSAVTGAIQQLVKLRDGHAEFISVRFAEHVYLVSLLAPSTGQADAAAAATINVWPSDDATQQARRDRSVRLWVDAQHTLPQHPLQLDKRLGIDEFEPARHGSQLDGVPNWQAMKSFDAALADVPGVEGAISIQRIQLQQKPEMQKLLEEMYSVDKPSGEGTLRWPPRTTRACERGMDFAPRHKLVGLQSVPVPCVLYTLEAFLRRELLAWWQSLGAAASAELLEPVAQLLRTLLADCQDRLEQPKTPWEKWNVFASSDLLHELGRALGEQGYDRLPQALTPNKHTVGGITRGTEKLIHATRRKDPNAQRYALLLEQEAVLPAVVLSQCQGKIADEFRKWQADTAPKQLHVAPYTLRLDLGLSTLAPWDRGTLFRRRLEPQRFRAGSSLTRHAVEGAYVRRCHQYADLKFELEEKLQRWREASTPVAGTTRKATASPSNSDAASPPMFTAADAKLLATLVETMQSSASTLPTNRDQVLRSLQDDRDKIVKPHADNHYDGFAHASMNASAVFAVAPPSVGASDKPCVRRLDTIDSGICIVGGRAGTLESTLTLAQSRTEMCMHQGRDCVHDVKFPTVTERAAQSLAASDDVEREASNVRETGYAEQMHGNLRRSAQFMTFFDEHFDELANELAATTPPAADGRSSHQMATLADDQSAHDRSAWLKDLEARTRKMLRPTMWTSARDHSQTALGRMPMDSSGYMEKRLPNTSNKAGRRGPERDQLAAEFAYKYFNSFGGLLRPLTAQQRPFYDTTFLESAKERVRQRIGKDDFLPMPLRVTRATKSKPARKKSKTASSECNPWLALGALNAKNCAPLRNAALSARHLKRCETTSTRFFVGDCFQFCTQNKKNHPVLWQGRITRRKARSAAASPALTGEARDAIEVPEDPTATASPALADEAGDAPEVPEDPTTTVPAERQPGARSGGRTEHIVFEAHVLFEVTLKPGRCPFRRLLSWREHDAIKPNWDLCTELLESKSEIKMLRRGQMTEQINHAYDERVKAMEAAAACARVAPRQRSEGRARTGAAGMRAAAATVVAATQAVAPCATAHGAPDDSLQWLYTEVDVPFHAAERERYSRAEATAALTRCYVPSLGQGGCTDFPATCYHSSLKGCALAAFAPTSDRASNAQRRSPRQPPPQVMWKLVFFLGELDGEQKSRDTLLGGCRKNRNRSDRGDDEDDDRKRGVDSKQAEALARSRSATARRFHQVQWRTRTAIDVPERINSAVPPTGCMHYNYRIMQLYRFAASKQCADDPALDPTQFDPDELNVCWTPPNDDTKWAAQVLHRLLQQPTWASHGVSWRRLKNEGTQLTACAPNSAVTERADGFVGYDQVFDQKTVKRLNKQQRYNTLRGQRALATQLSSIAKSLSDDDRLSARQYGVREGSAGEQAPRVEGAAFALAFNILYQHAQHDKRPLVDFHFVNTANSAATFSWHIDLHAEDEGQHIDRSRLFQLSPGKTAMLIARNAVPPYSPPLDAADREAIALMAKSVQG